MTRMIKRILAILMYVVAIIVLFCSIGGFGINMNVASIAAIIIMVNFVFIDPEGASKHA